MPGTRKPFLRIVLGPTASGKESLAFACASRIDGEIVSVDSMKIYRGLEVGTAKADEHKRASVLHHCLDIASPYEPFSVADFVRHAEVAIVDIVSRGKVPIMSGGTALYYKGLLEGIFEGPPADPVIRERLNRRAKEEGAEALHKELSLKDRQAAGKIHPNDAKRIIRALEVVELTGEPISHRQRQWEGFADTRDENRSAAIVSGVFRYPCAIVAPNWPREVLHRRIGERVERMMEAGLLEEARMVYENREKYSHTTLQAVAYKEFFGYFAGESSIEEAVELLKRNTRRLAKGQMTWFRKFPCKWLSMEGGQVHEELVGKVIGYWDKAGRR